MAHVLGDLAAEAAAQDAAPGNKKGKGAAPVDPQQQQLRLEGLAQRETRCVAAFDAARLARESADDALAHGRVKGEAKATLSAKAALEARLMCGRASIHRPLGTPDLR